MSSKCLLIVTSDVAYAQALRKHFSPDIWTVQHTNCLPLGDLNAWTGWDVVMLDQPPGHLVDLDDLVQALRREHRFEAPIVALLDPSNVDKIVALLDAGADRVAAKHCAGEELEALCLALVTQVRRRLPAPQLTVGDLTYDANTNVLRQDGNILSLPPKTLKVLVAMMDVSPEVVPVGMLETVITRDRPLHPSALRAHIVHLRRAIEHANNHTRILSVWGCGYRIQSLAPLGIH